MLFVMIVGTIVVAMLASLVTVPLAIRLGHRYGLLDLPGKRKRHKKPTPVIGGLAMFVSVWVTVALSVAIWPEQYGSQISSLGYVFAGSLILVLTGLSDDLSPLSAWIKLMAQVAAGLVLYLGGLQVTLLTTPWGSADLGSLSVVITVLWVVGLSNAINLIDGLDGLASGVSLISCLAILVIGQLYQVGGMLVFIAAMTGFLGLFLFYNSHPAKIFLGDSGSMQIGYYFAVFSLAFPLKSYTLAALYVPLLALGVPILEAASSIVRRSLSGRNVMEADRRHLFHYLALAGFSKSRVILVFYSLSAVFGGFAVAMCYLNRLWVLGLLALFMVVILTVFYILISGLSRRRRG